MQTNKIVCFLNNTIQEISLYRDIFLISYRCSVPYAYLYHTRMVHTICVYAYGITIRVWYGLLYHTRMVHMRHHWCI